ncbi:bifunctional diguanylate cyclase/phosphodiesterase [Salinisphaera sp. Q1T1-3]|uniref:putative bifunctional diguanylate cyclase/phosphodiesterase n=1 Tax=Salinisphaera sp. Q1T1-3 TaxID=2321229 RepID=UPI000E7593FB|nr:EAL domain-containing protein [Salinisphaera sp. Q1T1-3]RJS91767.1 EAL domain-containing protein [Salinisphaera sp. Q1T1-3]
MSAVEPDVVLFGALARDQRRRQLAPLVHSAAHAIESRLAVLFIVSDCGHWLQAEAALGLTARCDDMAVPDQWQREAPRDPVDLLEALNTRTDHDWVLPALPTQIARADVEYAVLVPIADNGRDLQGALLLADNWAEPDKKTLTPAQRYVLKTHAAQIGALLSSHVSASTQLTTNVRERLRLLESVVIHANDAVLITEAEPIDMPGPRIVYCNAAFTRTTGYALDEVVGLTPRILQREDTDRAALDTLRRALSRWKPVEVELINQHKNGTPFWVELSIVPVANESGWFTHWISVQRDISQRKETEQVADQARAVEAEKIALEAKLEERKRIERQLAHAAYHDDLTGLRNRAHVMQLLSARLGPPEAQSGFLLFMDLDRFKLVNDSLGHRAGDLLLVDVARRLEDCLGEHDTLARVSGDEFVILHADGETVDRAMALAARVVRELERAFRIYGHDLFVSTSIGIVDIALGYDTVEDLMRDADTAMYAAKTQGPGRYSLFTESMRADVVAELAIQTELKQALAREEFELYYQPVYDLAGAEVRGVEALLRWHHPTRGMLLPGTFIGIAEDIGVIESIGRWVLYSGCRQVAAWNRARRATGRDPLQLFVNVSSHELRQHDFSERLTQALDETGLPPTAVQLEITERLFLQNPEQVSELLEALRARGVHIALDDFGTGYSSLAYLDRYAFDTLKIDRSFIQRMSEAPRTLAIIEMIVALGQRLGLEIIAEGIETAVQMDTVRSLGCPLAQGFHLARPMAAADCAAVVI